MNQYAFEGGDTGPNEKAAIKERNEALQELSDKQREVAEKRDEAVQESYDASIKAEQAVAESNQALVTGAAIGEEPMPSAADYGSESGSGKSSSKKSSS